MMDTDAECRRLAGFARASAASAAGFWWLDESGRPDPAEPVHTWITARMTHVFALAHLRGDIEGAAELAAHGVRALSGALCDVEFGGWFASVSGEGEPVGTLKEAYAHAFVVLAATSGVAAGVPGADALLDEALGVMQQHFLDDSGRVVDSLERDLRSGEAYRGANSSMHTVEAFLAAGDVTGDAAWHRRALAIAEHLIHGVARSHGYDLPEHFDLDWSPVLDYNADRPGDPFRPYGCTPGHLLEWSRLLLHLDACLDEAPTWLVEDARALFERAVEVGWSADGETGFVYTTAWDGTPVTRLRLHWVAAEALAAAGALYTRTGEAAYDEWRQRFEDYIEAHLVDRELGSWHHELDEHNRPSHVIWHGKPDVYHAYQALLLARMPLAPVLSVQLAAAGPGQAAWNERRESPRP
ncbi:AGE family epimerase/isomerase [Nocardioides sp. KC13]|uniref:AGE family epimerase/isomerase n=1 Tax=Nocardioides turkmenicus TaxID=2711220 RepID=A0A6M1RB48_9ACTN|nr:AGE family epimerase/isomerase [Nocardioides sp. KC13]NGN94848.1 AGE family epimerase/isomerase [Nocardioides sp. KC13]